MEIKAPDIGVESAEVAEILVSVGDSITTEDNIVLIESDKAAVEVPSSANGIVSKILVSEGDTVSEGSVLIELEVDSDSNNDANSPENGSENGSESSHKTDQDSKDKTNERVNNQQTQDNSDSNDTTMRSNEQSSGSSDTVSESGSTQTYSLPDLGVETAEVAEMMVSVGDSVEADQSLLLIESDKASVEVPSPVTGIVEEILISAGDSVVNGQEFIVIKSAGSTNAGSTNKDQDIATTSNQSSDSNSKTGSESKAANTSSSDTSNKQSSTANKAKDSNNAKGSLQSQDANQDSSSTTKLSESEVNKKLADIYAGPAVRKLARQLGVDITQVTGSAINGRIIKEDVFDYVKSTIQSQKKGSDNTGAYRGSNSGISGLPNLPDMSNKDIWGEVDTQDLSRLQKVSIPQLNYNTYLPQVTQFDLSDITETEKLRKQLKGEFKSEGIGLTILAFIVKATAYALTQYPRFNSHLSDDNTQIHVRKSINMGIAVATDDGLIVPVIKEAQNKGIKQIAIEIGELAVKARDKKLTAKELQGASFSISSQGNLGGTYFTPLVNWPQVGILGVSEASMQPRWNEQTQSFEPRLMLPLSLSYDHRVINGADAAVFTRYVAKLLEDPRRILI